MTRLDTAIAQLLSLHCRHADDRKTLDDGIFCLRLVKAAMEHIATCARCDGCAHIAQLALTDVSPSPCDFALCEIPVPHAHPKL